MNIVKGVADLIRRSSSVSSGESTSGSSALRFPPPSPKICFSEVGDEGILHKLWEKYENAVDKVEKKKLLSVFLKQFLAVFKNWEPFDNGHSIEADASTVPPPEYPLRFDDVIVGCSSGHPAEVILTLTEEVAQLTMLVVDLDNSVVHPKVDLPGTSKQSNIGSDGVLVLDALAIINRSMHNCRVFGYYGGIQKLSALMKGAVVQLKAINGALTDDESLGNVILERMGFLQEILMHSVLILHNFIDLNTGVFDKSNWNSYLVGMLGPCTAEPSGLPTEPRVYWHHKAVVSVMEAGGLNWLVELLRVVRRLNMKDLQTDISLQYLTLSVLLLSLSENPRGQNHFKSIGGLEVLLDGLGISSSNVFQPKDLPHEERDQSPLLQVFQLHILYMMVLKEAVFANLNNLQFLCENGRIEKFANSFCSLAFLLQEYHKISKIPLIPAIHISELKNENHAQMGTSATLSADASCLQLWSGYVVKLSRALCSFVVAPENARSHHVQVNTGRLPLPISSAYGELSIRWFLRVLRTIFPCIKACSNQHELPNHLRLFVNALQHCILDALKNVLVSSPASLEIFREEGLWDLLFSENFFHFGPASDQLLGEYPIFGEGLARDIFVNLLSGCADNEIKTNGVEILQIEVISFVEFAATSNGTVHNLPELSALMDALEQCTFHPAIAKVLAKSLVHIIQLSPEKTLASLRTLNAIPRLLNVTYMQAEESRRFQSSGHSPGNKVYASQSDQGYDSAQSWLECMESCMALIAEFVSAADDARSSILCDSASIDCLFNLFWDGSMRNCVLTHILDLMKILPLSAEDQKAKLYLCSKYLEMFTQIKEKEKNFAGLSIDLLIGMREMLTIDPTYYQSLFRDGECFLHVVSLLNGNLDELNGEKLVLNVLQTLTSLLAGNDESKASFRALVGKGYQTMQSLLLDFCQWNPSEIFLNTLLDMLVDGKFDANANPIIKNEDVVVLYLSVLQKSSDSLRHYGLNVFLQLLRDSISNRASCVRAGIMSFLLDWFAVEDKDTVILKLAQLVQVIGGHSISGKDIRKIFALLRGEKVGARQQYCSLLLTTILAMLNEKGPTSFFDLNGNDSGIIINTPFQWPISKGFSFSCWLRVESFPGNGTMGLFQFLTENGKGCLAVLGKDMLTYESIHLKQQSVKLSVNLVRKKWHFLCLTHSIGRAFSGGSLLRCYVDGELVSSERCRYAKVNDVIVNCGIGMLFKFPRTGENNSSDPAEVFGFHGQIGPVYLFSDAISPEHIQGIYSLGPSYMYSFLDNEATLFRDEPLPSGVLDARDGLASKIVFGLNAQASNRRKLFNVSPMLDHTLDKKPIEATVTLGTQLCSRRLLQQILYCVGGISVFFPIIAQSDKYEDEGVDSPEHMLLTPITKDRLLAEVIELIASVLDDNLANQRQMHLLSGFPILGFLLQSVPPEQLNLETFSALKHLFNIAASGVLADLLVKDAVSSIFLNPLIWVFTDYNVQRELYMFLIQVFDNQPMLLKSLCQLPLLIDIVRKFYWDQVTSRSVFGSKPLLHPVTKNIIGERPRKEDIHKIRLLILSLGEMNLRQNIAAMDIKALVAFFETNQDMQCIEDMLHMIIRPISQPAVLASFLEQVNLIGGSHIFINLLQREHEPIRLLSLQFLGKLMVGLPSEKKGPRLFSFPVGKSRSLSENHKKLSFKMQPIFSAVSDRLFRFPLTDNLCATLFDVLLGGASPKQVLQKHGQLDKQRIKTNDSHFVLPQILVLIFRFLSSCEDACMRIKVLNDLLDLLDSNSSNVEALMEYGWNAWLMSTIKLDVMRDYRCKYADQKVAESAEQNLVRTIFVVVLGHYICSVKGGWQQFEDTVNFLLMNEEQGGSSFQYLLRDINEDLTLMLVDHSSEENIFASQPCRDNILFLLRLTDEMLASEIGHEIPFPAYGNEMSLLAHHLETPKDFGSSLYEVSQGEFYDQGFRNPWCSKNLVSQTDDISKEKLWSLYDNIWSIICAINGKGLSKGLPKSSSNVGPSLGQRARGLVESLNVPAAEMAAVVVSGGIGSALGGKPNKSVDRAMVLRGERCPRIFFRLAILYLCKSSLERASRCVQLVISLLPSVLVGDDEQTKNRLHLFIWALLAVRSQYGMLDDGARFHVISHLIRETVLCGKSLLATSIAGRDEFSDSGSNSKDVGLINNLIQKDRVLLAVSDEVKYLKASVVDRSKQLEEFQVRMAESFSAEAADKELFEEDIRNSLDEILAWDDARRAAVLLTYEEQHQNIAEKWIHIFRTLIDERGPWSASPFPDCPATYWKLDKTEDAWRRRQKLRQNYHFDDQLCHPPSTSSGSQEQLPSHEIKSNIVGHIPDQMRQFLLKGIRKITDESSEDDPESSNQKESLSTDSSEGQCLEPKGVTDQKDITHDIRDSPFLEKENSEVLRSVPCVLVTPKRKVAGNLAVMKTVLHFFGEFLVEGTGGSSVFTNFHVSKSSDASRLDQKSKSHVWLTHADSRADKVEAADDNANQRQLKHVKRHRRWNIGKIKAVHWTRYLLRNTAIEIFFGDSVSPIFLNFASQKDAKEVGTLIVVTRNEFLFPKGSNKDKSGIISFIDRRLAIEKAENARESWRRREITNFEYLMILNTLSGRSYNDLTQYPVFPWILADYSSEVLDFNKSSTFRDLTKPVGALDLKRFEVFEDRYHNFSDPDIPSFYYGSHYSSMGIVLYYLLRLEPFTSLHRSLQGGKFDHADRLFQSIEGTYKNCLTNTSDVKELIPEFFYMSEFLINSNSYHLGVKQDGDPINDVCLPPWAKGSPELFVSKNREALESEYVSSNLHHWIDLVFGYKQRGKPAVEAANIFYYLTYEGAVDLESMEDELQRSAIEDQIANFGQTPIQLFRKKHPRRGPPIPIAHPLRFAPASISLTSVVSTTSNPSWGVLYVRILDSTIVVVNQGQLLSVKMWLSTQLHSGGNFTFSGFQDPLFGVGSDILSPRKIGSPLAENAELGTQCFATLQTPAENFLISCGNWENSFQVSSLNDGRTVQSIRQHKDVVSCVAVTEDGCILATGSYDTTVMVWDVLRFRASERRVRSSTTELPRKDYVIAETPFHILCGHDDVVTCLFASVELDIVVSGSKDGTCIFHTLRKGTYVRSVRHPTGCALSKLAASRHGRVAFYADDDLTLHLYSINGKHLATCESNGRLNCIEVSKSGEFLVCGGDQGQIIVRSMDTLDVVRRYNGIGKIITCLTVTQEECFLVGTKDGCLLVYSIENPQLRRSSIPRNVKSKASVTG